MVSAYTPLAGLMILLVEDDSLILADLDFTLSRKGACVVAAASLEEAMAVSDDRSFDIALLDIRLQDKLVTPLAQKLSQRDIPLIFHSAVAERQNLEKMFPDALTLSKPVSETILVDSVKKRAKG